MVRLKQKEVRPVATTAPPVAPEKRANWHRSRTNCSANLTSNTQLPDYRHIRREELG